MAKVEIFSVEFVLCCERNLLLDVPAYVFGQGIGFLVSSVLHHFSGVPQDSSKLFEFCGCLFLFSTYSFERYVS